MQDSPFFTVKLNIKTLPCVIFFRKGMVVGQVVGFDGLGGLDDFETAELENLMDQAEVSGERGAKVGACPAGTAARASALPVWGAEAWRRGVHTAAPEMRGHHHGGWTHRR